MNRNRPGFGPALPMCIISASLGVCVGAGLIYASMPAPVAEKVYLPLPAPTQTKVLVAPEPSPVTSYVPGPTHTQYIVVDRGATSTSSAPPTFATSAPVQPISAPSGTSSN